jgi:hypothetical protein
VRSIVIALGLAYLAVAAVLFALRLGPAIIAVLLAVNGLIVVGAIVFERSRYRPVPSGDDSRILWQPTGERFIDPTSGRMVEVEENTLTGERIYKESKAEEE